MRQWKSLLEDTLVMDDFVGIAAFVVVGSSITSIFFYVLQNLKIESRLIIIFLTILKCKEL